MASRSLNVVITGDAKNFRAAVRDVDRDSDRLERRFKSVGDSAGHLTLRFGALGGSVGSMLPVLAASVPALGAVSGAAVTVGSSLAAAAAGAGALGAGLGASLAPIAVVGKQVTSRFEEIKKAYDALQTAQREGTDAAKKNAQQAMEGLSKNERAMVQSLERVSGLQRKVLGPASDKIFGALAGAIEKLAPAAEKLREPFTRLGGAIGDSIGRIADWLSGSATSRAFKAFVDSATKIVEPITTVFLRVGGIIRDVATAALPLVRDALRDAAGFFEDLDEKATRSKIREIVGGLVSQTKSWFGLLSEVGGLIGRVFTSGADDGQTLVDKLTGVVHAVNGFIDGMREGSGAGGEFAAKVRDAAQKAGEAFQSVRGFVERLRDTITAWVDKNRGDINSVISAFKSVASFAKDVFLGTMLPIIRRTVEAAGKQISSLVGIVRGVVRLVSGLLSGDWQKAWDGLKEVVRNAFKIVKTVVVNNLDNIAEVVKDLGPKIVKAIGKGLLNFHKTLIKGLMAGIELAAKELPGLAGDALKGIGHAITSGISKGFGKLNPFGDGIGIPPTNALSGGTGLMGAKSTMGWIASAAGRFGLHTSSGLRPGAITSSGNPSFHGSGDALDEAGTPAGMLGFFRYMKSKFGGILRELIYTPGGIGIKDGRPFRYSGQVAADHYDHVHVAFTGGAGDGVGDGIGQIKSLWTREGGDPSKQNIAAAVAMAESGGNPTITNRNSDGSIDRGLWQINSVHGALSTLDREGNARAAISISSNGRNWNPWVAFKNGSYKRFLTATGNVKAGKTYKKGQTASGGTASHGQYDPTATYEDENSAAPAFSLTPTMSAADLAAALKKGNVVRPHDRPLKGGGPTKGLTPDEAAARGSGSTGPSEFDYLDLALANAEATAGLGDDLGALSAIRDYRARALGSAQATGDPRLIAQARRDLTNAESSLKQLTDVIQASVDQTAALAEQTKNLVEEVKRQTDFASSVQATETFQLKRILGDLVNGELGGRGVARRFTAGSGVEYAY